MASEDPRVVVASGTRCLMMALRGCSHLWLVLVKTGTFSNSVPLDTPGLFCDKESSLAVSEDLVERCRFDSSSHQEPGTMERLQV